jgi:hypothetical protein
VSLDFTGHTGSGACLLPNADDIVIESVELFGCSLEPVWVGANGSSGITLLNNHFHDNGGPVAVNGNGALVQGNLFENHLSSGSLAVHGPNSQIRDNEIYDSGTDGIYLNPGADGVVLVGNLVVRSGDYGMNFGGLTAASVWFNTVVDSGVFGVSIGTASQVDFRNNIISVWGTAGINGRNNKFTDLTYNLFSGNGTNCNSCSSLDVTNVEGNPLFIDAGSDDYGLGSGSPAIDTGYAGPDLVEDRNGAAGNDFNGTAPDRGAFESP